MARKQSTGLCLFFKGEHYFIPMGKIDNSPHGDMYWFYGKNKGYTSFHKSGRVHDTDQHGNRKILNEIGSNELIKDFYGNTLDPLLDMNPTEQEFYIGILKGAFPFLKNNGCFDPDCKNRIGEVIKFDGLLKFITEYLNENLETYLQIGGSTENTFDPEEDDEEEYSDKFTDVVSPRLNIERIPYCKACIGKRYIQYNEEEERFFLKDCPDCGGIGFELGGVGEI